MRELSIVLGFIRRGDTFLLQFRDGDPKIGAVNLIGCFGGKIETGETPETAVCRELTEETTLNIAPEDIEKLGQVKVVSDHQLEQVSVTADVFMIKTDDVDVRAREGKLIELGLEEIEGKLPEMTPGTRAAFKKFILSEV
jgi:ADP-ribose pyrophosphatase YjhB (NUDIX family)